MNCILEIPKIIIWVTLGCLEEERELLKPIELKLVLAFNKTPIICLSDNIEEGLCYDAMVRSLVKFAQDKAYCTIEKWAFELSKHLKQAFKLHSSLDSLSLKITKLRVPVDNITAGVSFIYNESFIVQ